MKPVRLGICGLGTVASGTVNVLTRNQREINARACSEITITHIGARRDNPNCDTANFYVTRDIFDVVNNPDVDVVVELIGGTTIARDLVLQAIANGKHVVTANKALIAEHGNEVFAKAKEAGVTVAFEAGVAGGIPVIKAIREGLAANKIEQVSGIINGTGNFILTEMRDKGRAFDDVLKEAQELGYAEADPTFDVEGVDAAHKLVILASIAFGMPLRFDQVFMEGITKITAEDVAYAEELGYRIKHLGVAKRTDTGVELRVHPAMIAQKQILANVDGVLNAVHVLGDAVGPTLYSGAGAGAEPTASAVIADIVDLARTLTADPEHRVPHLGFHPDALSDLTVLPIEDTVCAHYLRLNALDKPGVLSKIAQILSDAGVSIEALIQKDQGDSSDHVPLIMLTNKVREGDLITAINAIAALDTVVGPVMHIRVADLG